MRESEAALRQLAHERNEAEREKWTILRHARDEAERSGQLSGQLAARDARIDQLQDEVAQLRAQLGNGRHQPLYSSSRRASPTLGARHQASAGRLSATGSSGGGPWSVGTAASSHRHRSSISSMDSAAIVSDAGDEPLYSRIDHSSSTTDSHGQQPKSLPPLPPQQDGNSCPATDSNCSTLFNIRNDFSSSPASRCSSLVIRRSFLIDDGRDRSTALF